MPVATQPFKSSRLSVEVAVAEDNAAVVVLMSSVKYTYFASPRVLRGQIEKPPPVPYADVKNTCVEKTASDVRGSFARWIANITSRRTSDADAAPAVNVRYVRRMHVRDDYDEYGRC